MNNRQLTTLADTLRGKGPQEVDDVLRRWHLDPQDRLAVKVQLAAGPGLRASGGTARGRVQASFELATDGAEDRGLKSPMAHLLARIGIDAQRMYTEAELSALLHQAGLDPEQCIACKIEVEARGLLATARAARDEATRLLIELVTQLVAEKPKPYLADTGITELDLLSFGSCVVHFPMSPSRVRLYIVHGYRSTDVGLQYKPGQEIVYLSADLRRPCWISVSPDISTFLGPGGAKVKFLAKWA